MPSCIPVLDEEGFPAALGMTEQGRGKSQRKIGGPRKTPVFMRVWEGTVEGCGKEKFVCNGVLTIRVGMLILVSSLEATLLDRGGRTNAL